MHHQAFSLAPNRCSVITDPALRAEIDEHTGSPEATSKILRSIERFGVDPSVLRFEMNPKKENRTIRSTETVSWTVHAVRNRPEPVVETP